MDAISSTSESVAMEKMSKSIENGKKSRDFKFNIQRRNSDSLLFKDTKIIAPTRRQSITLSENRKVRPKIRRSFSFQPYANIQENSSEDEGNNNSDANLNQTQIFPHVLRRYDEIILQNGQRDDTVHPAHMTYEVSQDYQNIFSYNGHVNEHILQNQRHDNPVHSANSQNYCKHISAIQKIPPKGRKLTRRYSSPMFTSSELPPSDPYISISRPKSPTLSMSSMYAALENQEWCEHNGYNINDNFESSKNDYFYYKLFSLTASKVSSQWQEFVRVLLKNYPSWFIDAEIKILLKPNKCDKDIVHNFLIRWKLFFCTDINFDNVELILANAAEEVGVKGLHDMLKQCVKDDTDNSVVINDEYLKYLSTRIKSEWMKFGRALGFQENELQMLERRNKTNQGAIFAMLILWKKDGSSHHHIQTGQLIRAFLHCGRQDLAEELGHTSLTSKLKPPQNLDKFEKKEELIDMEEQYEEYQRKWESIRTPDYFISSYLGKINNEPKVIVDIEKNHKEKATTFLNSHFEKLMTHGRIWIEEQESFELVMTEENSACNIPSSSVPSYVKPFVQTASRISYTDISKLHDQASTISDISPENYSFCYGSLCGFMKDQDNNLYGMTSSHFLNSTNNEPVIGKWESNRKVIISEAVSDGKSKVINLGSDCSGMFGWDEDMNAIDITVCKIRMEALEYITLPYTKQDGTQTTIRTFTQPDKDLLLKRVRKYGHKSLTTDGFVIMANGLVKIKDHQCRGAFFVRPDPKQKQDCFAQKGDSGSLVVCNSDDSNLTAYGIVLSTNPRYIYNGNPIGPVAICLRIDNAITYIQKHFGLDLTWCNDNTKAETQLTPQGAGATLLKYQPQTNDPNKAMESETLKD